MREVRDRLLRDNLTIDLLVFGAGRSPTSTNSNA